MTLANHVSKISPLLWWVVGLHDLALSCETLRSCRNDIAECRMWPPCRAILAQGGNFDLPALLDPLGLGQFDASWVFPICETVGG